MRAPPFKTLQSIAYARRLRRPANATSAIATRPIDAGSGTAPPSRPLPLPGVVTVRFTVVPVIPTVYVCPGVEPVNTQLAARAIVAAFARCAQRHDWIDAIGHSTNVVDVDSRAGLNRQTDRVRRGITHKELVEARRPDVDIEHGAGVECVRARGTRRNGTDRADAARGKVTGRIQYDAGSLDIRRKIGAILQRAASIMVAVPVSTPVKPTSTVPPETVCVAAVPEIFVTPPAGVVIVPVMRPLTLSVPLLLTALVPVADVDADIVRVQDCSGQDRGSTRVVFAPESSSVPALTDTVPVLRTRPEAIIVPGPP